MTVVVQSERTYQLMPDLAEQFRRLLLAQDRDKPNTLALAAAIGVALQAVEDDLFNLPLATSLRLATGDALDRVGAMVGEDRLGLDDGAFRRFIGARILVSQSEGTPEELLAIFRIITGTPDCYHFDLPPGGFLLFCVRKSWMTEAEMRRVRRMMTDAKAAGVAMELIEAAPGYFGFVEDSRAGAFDIGTFSRVIE